ncbi:MAG: bifunctional (p)ppGpp synthetase/guanosine-3',5'-bis(diphosphate) 3'-pyrophosphohydrolase [Candidatus Coatesbacteria bacterium]|nr:bifunctional (p)ppGpp synthetase/guanosine-3',5'-bis(diphosphate) 3'-pyrophosphohydrolase [Candidatus Coatesbacteria bacterium]
MVLNTSAEDKRKAGPGYEARLRAIKRTLLSRYPDASAVDAVDNAFEFAAEYHRGQRRASGEHFIEHPLSVAEILTEWELAPELIIAALLHDVLEDASPSDVVGDDAGVDAADQDETKIRERSIEARKLIRNEIDSRFGKDVTEIVEGLTKVDRLVLESREERTLENLKRFFVAVGKDLRVVPIKLADRLHNMRTLGSLPEWKQRRTAKETLNLYAPLAYRFGMGEVQAELEDLAFKCVLPDIYFKLAEKLKATKDQRLAALHAAEKALKKQLAKTDIPATITSRSKHYYSIYRKMVRQGLTIDEVMDIVGIRVIAKTERACYRVLGEVHSLWLPIPGTFKDYIATPKSNMYQSLHTVVLIDPGYQMEIQIRTERMHLVAERGIAAHWRYKAMADRKVLRKLYKDSDVSQWVEEFITSYIEKDKGTQLLDGIKTMLQSEDIYVMTPKGEMRSFQHGATLIDFAYSIHTSVGNQFSSGKVGGVNRPPDYELKTGDVVEIITDKKAHPKKEWLNFAKTPFARHAIQRWFKVEERHVMAEIGRSVLEEKLRMARVPVKEFYKSPNLAPFLDRSGLSDVSELHEKLSTGKMKLIQALQAVLPKTIFEKVQSLQISKTPPEEDLLGRIMSYKKGLVISDTTSSEVILAKCCHPLPGDVVVGYIKRGSGVSIHRLECSQVEQLLPDNIRILRNIRWSVPKNSTFDAMLKLKSVNAKGILVSITKALLAADIDIQQIRSDKLPDASIAFKINIFCHSSKQIEKAMDSLNDIEGMIEVVRQ